MLIENKSIAIALQKHRVWHLKATLLQTNSTAFAKLFHVRRNTGAIIMKNKNKEINKYEHSINRVWKDGTHDRRCGSATWTSSSL